jgi:hypothetical protein
MNKGFLIVAQNTEDTDYIKCATVLAKSIKKVMPREQVVLLTHKIIENNAFDKVIKFPYGDLNPTGKWKLVNDWQVYKASPFEYTIKLEADMYLPQNIDYWWDVLKQRDFVVSTTIRDFKQNISNVRAYRKFIDDNKLPDVYNALTYFKKSETARLFYEIVRNVFENWNEWKKILICHPNEPITTDWAYAIAAHYIGIEKTTMPQFKEMSMIHMKQYINGLPTEDWTNVLIHEKLPHTLRINTIPQMYPFHYHIKTFANELEA